MGWSSMSARTVPPADRFEWFREALSSDLMPIALSTEHTADFRAEITNLGLGPAQVSTFAFSSVRGRRTVAHVRRGDPEQYQLALVTRGAIHTSQLGHESLVTQGLVLTDTSRPMDNTTRCDDGQAHVVMLQIPRAVLPLRSDRVDRLLAQRIPESRGTAAVLVGFLRTLLEHGPRCEPEELSRLGQVAVDLATACLAQHLGALGEAPAEARAQVMLQRITAFIEHNLGDPDLTPQTIADRHNISPRTLYALFYDQPASVAGFIRRTRLERCRADLGRRELSNQPVQAIAARWGFSNATTFGRAFRDAYGITPTEHRANALQPTAGTDEKPHGTQATALHPDLDWQ
ncbi:helix-turn-helix domain-containing protein [Kitasatospora sp. NBC_00374]|uniref:AraC-like ligand-binding domain-containing protein n=1 Tax=Kitasatospora sp. NBC_00374 TaxID=2975964 RepID=UPI0030E40C03